MCVYESERQSVKAAGCMEKMFEANVIEMKQDKEVEAKEAAVINCIA